MATKKKATKKKTTTSTSSKKTTEKEKENLQAFGIIGYIIPLIGIIWYLVDETVKKNKFVVYHAKQMLILLVTAIIISALTWIPIVGRLLWIFQLYWIITGIITYTNGEKKELWLIGQYESKFKF